MSTTKDLAQLINATAHLQSEGMLVPVQILDARVSFGKIHVQVTPVGGEGNTWVDRERVWLQGDVTVAPPLALIRRV